jgi:DNA-binding response OmpR family regulator
MSKRSASILMMDDEQDIVRALQRGLIAHGYTVRTARSGEMRLRRWRPDLLVLGLLLPGLSGLEVCCQV